MDEVEAFCVRMLGPGEAAYEAAQAASAAGEDDRLRALTAAAAECRNREEGGGQHPAGDDRPVRAAAQPSDDRGAEPATEDPEGPTEPDRDDDPRDGDGDGEETEPETAGGGGPTLAEAVASELAEATGRLPERQREALALRELLELPHAEIAQIVGVEPVAVAPLLARARLRLRAELRGASPPDPDCPERDRALRTIALRQDGEEVAEVDDDWLVEHLGHCEGCRRAHAAMLEASACYRAWRLPEAEPEPAPAGA